ncbi:hypothetical protein [Bacteroides helcogenes]|uniref:hypothetical protein n=1 Tax=Bacteroides helcogenes TaxID=290053 RepID=UPI000307D23B|nr:hypothetical protein [Bacteroides helcogenes]MDY5238898.1 hypothetical protein [Bacteroides helcogenes]
MVQLNFHSVSHPFPKHGCKGIIWQDCQRQGRAAEPFQPQSSLPTGGKRILPENPASVSHTLIGHPAAETND